MDESVVTFKMTCGACPEQYDALDQYGLDVGYLRLRHGHFTVSRSPGSDRNLYESATEGDGAFYDSREREHHLQKAAEALGFDSYVTTGEW